MALRNGFEPHRTNTATPKVTHRVATPQAAIVAALTIERADYADELEAYLDSKSYKDTNIAMRTNRAIGF